MNKLVSKLTPIVVSLFCIATIPPLVVDQFRDGHSGKAVVGIVLWILNVFNVVNFRPRVFNLKKCTAVAAFVTSCLCADAGQFIDQSAAASQADGKVFVSMQTAVAQPSQTNAPPVQVSSNPFTTIFGYFTSFNRSLTNTFSTNNFYQAWTGVSYQSGVNLGGVIGLEAQPIAKFHGFTLRSADTLAAQVGTLSDAELDLGYSFAYVDTRTEFFIGADLINKGAGGPQVPEAVKPTFGVEFEKAVSDIGFGGVYAEYKARYFVIGFIAGVSW